MNLFLVVFSCFCLLSFANWVPIIDSQPQPNPTWDQVKSLSFLYYSYAAYCPQVSIFDWSCVWCTQPGVSNFLVTDFPHNTTARTSAFVGYDADNNTIVVSFRGSDNIKNWIVDFKFNQTAPYSDPNILVHSGFYFAYGNLSSQVRDAVSGLLNKFASAKIAVTGHSLGAALSVFCALDLATVYPSKTILVNNFGQPRCGNKAFADWYKSITNIVTWRVINNEDVVPNLPPKVMDFYHAPTEVWERTDGSTGNQYYKVCSSFYGEDVTCAGSTKQNSTDDHLNYMGLFLTC